VVAPVTIAVLVEAVLAAAGVAALVWAASPDGPAAISPDRAAGLRRVGAGAASGAAAGVVVGVATGWPVAGAWAAVAGFAAPAVLAKGRGRRAQTARVDAVARWARMIADQVRVGADLGTALRLSARHAPAPLAAALDRLARALVSDGPEVALARFADQLADPMADLVAGALTMAMTRPTGHVADLLAELARACEEQAGMRLRIEADRRRVRTVVRASAVAIGGWLAAIFALSGHYFDPYTTASGQLMLVIVGGAFAAGTWGLVRMDTVSAPPRLMLNRRQPHPEGAGR
jgi:Flp pilus assembly protein TadB